MKILVYYKKKYTFINIVKSLWKSTYFVMLIYRGHEQLRPIYDNVSGTSKIELSQFGHQIHNVFSIIANCLWKGVDVSTLLHNCITGCVHIIANYIIHI